MASTSPLPSTSPPTAVPPTSTPPPPGITIPLVPPLPSTTPPANSAPPPATPTSPPPPATPAAPPPATPVSPPPPVAPVVSPPPPNAPPPSVNSPPPPVFLSSPPPAASSPPPPVASSPPPPDLSPPPPAVASPPPSESAQPPPPPAAESPPPPAADPPTRSPPAPAASPPPAISPPPPPSDPSSPPAPAISSTPPPPQGTTNTSSSPSPLPLYPTQKPTAKPTTNSNVTVNGTPNSGGGRMKTGGVVAVGIIAGFFMLSLVIMAVWFTKKKKKGNRNFSCGVPSPFASSQNSDSAFLGPQSPAPLMLGSRSGSDVYPHSDSGVNNNSKSWFTYDELIQATNGFSTHNLLGEGGFGCVYKGVLVDGRVVAVKQLKIGGSQGEREFKAEVEIISRVHHRHLVSLVGYCISEHQRLLVYDYVPNNTLHHHLHGEDRPPMAWGIRIKVAAGSARGIAYLHEDCHPRIIHRDIKSSNILLDNNYDAQVSDFGLAKLALDSNTHVTTRVMGTFGYMAPEYATSGKLTEKSDVYSFGVVLLELITGRKPVDASQPLGDESLVEWARPLLTEALDTENFDVVADPRLDKNYDRREMFRMIEAAAACIRHSAAKRPRMGQIVRALDNLEDDISDLNNGVKPGQSEVYDSAEQSRQIRMFRRMAFGSQDHSTDFYERTHSSWASRDHRDRDQEQTPSSFGSSGDNSGVFQPQSSRRNRDEEDSNHSTSTTATTTTTTTTKKINPLAGFWDK